MPSGLRPPPQKNMSLLTLPDELIRVVCEFAGAKASCNLSLTNRRFQVLFRPGAWSVPIARFMHQRIGNSFISATITIETAMKTVDDFPWWNLEEDVGETFDLMRVMVEQAATNVSELFHTAQYAVQMDRASPLAPHLPVMRAYIVALRPIRKLHFDVFMNEYSPLRRQHIPALRGHSKAVWKQMDEGLDAYIEPITQDMFDNTAMVFTTTEDTMET